jgi:hypothetical protein
MAWLRFKRAWLLHQIEQQKAYNPNQPRVPAGSPDGGQWTSDDGGIGTTLANRERTRLADAANRTDSRVLSDALPDDRPVYDEADAALLAPKGLKPGASTQELRYKLGDQDLYLAGITLVNEDRTWVGRYLQATNGTPVAVRVEAIIETVAGQRTASFEFKEPLPPGGWISIPWNEIGWMRGPGNVTARVTNIGSLYAGVVIGAVRHRGSGSNAK